MLCSFVHLEQNGTISEWNTQADGFHTSQWGEPNHQGFGVRKMPLWSLKPWALIHRSCWKTLKARPGLSLKCHVLGRNRCCGAFFVVILCSHYGVSTWVMMCLFYILRCIWHFIWHFAFVRTYIHWHRCVIWIYIYMYHIDICSRRSILAVKCHGQSFLFDQIQRAIMYAYSHGSMVWVWEAFGGFGTWRPHFLWENPGPEGASRLLAVGQCHAVRSVSAGFNLLAHLFRFSQITNNVMCLGQYGSISMLRTKGMIFVFLGKLEETPLFHRIWVTWRNVYTDPCVRQLGRKRLQQIFFLAKSIHRSTQLIIALLALSRAIKVASSIPFQHSVVLTFVDLT